MSDSGVLPHSLNVSFVEALYQEYLSDPARVPADWRAYFERAMGRGPRGGAGPSFRPTSIFNPPSPVTNGARHGDGANGVATQATVSSETIAHEAMQDRVDQMVRAFRVRGHMIAELDPLGLRRPQPRELELCFYGFTEDDLERPFSSRTIKGPPVRSLRAIYDRLRNTYCRYIGVQYMHIDDIDVRHWLQERMEGTENRCRLTRTQQYRILTRLTDASLFEEFIQKKFLGAKSFSLEGAESLIPLLDLAIEKAGKQGIDEIVIGMAHRGRLNVLANILSKNPRQIFREFEDADAEKKIGGGDVKYHLGWHCEWVTASRKHIHLALCFNPSHLEFVNPVALGRLRAKQDRSGDREARRSLGILIHGDAAFAAEGVVQETLQLSELPGYRTGGTLHVIVNNQIGFTTSPQEARSSIYASSIGKMLQIPILLVNGEDPESVAQCVKVAMDFRRKFKRDVIIDMYCYRRRGHNETDEPAFTQPVMYEAIRKRPSVRQSYLERLMQFGAITPEAADEIRDQLQERLEHELSSARDDRFTESRRPSVLGKVWSNYKGGPDASVPETDTGVPAGRLSKLLEATTRVPEDFVTHKTLARLLEQRRQMAAGERPLDWAAAETLALASLATEGVRIRLSGQDCGRGTFSQRHAMLHDVRDGRRYIPLQHLDAAQAPVEIYNSPLSEAGVLGFEYGYSIAYPDALVMWEAQFGDFANAAQVIIDQFLVSAEDKWHSLSGLALLLPHGYEGQGPEHSSARLERFLALAAEDNIQVCYPTTPGQYFHLLRRQALRRWRKPLVVMTPKSLLRLDRATSSLADLASGRFRRILPDELQARPKIAKVLLCTGKVYYDLTAEREARGRSDVAIVRFEQLYPLAEETIAAALAAYPDDTPMVWVQEEPANMGAWPYLGLRFGERLLGRWRLTRVSRDASASPATGSAGAHKLEQRRLIDEAFGDADSRSNGAR